MAVPTVTVGTNSIEYRIPAGGYVAYTDEAGNELFRISADGDVVKVEGTTLDPALQAILNGVTATAAELNLIDGSIAGTTVASKAVVVDANSATSVLALPVSGLKIGAGAGTAVDATAAELNKVAGVTAGTTTASKAIVVDANSATSVLALPVSGLKIGAGAGTAVDATAANLNTLASVTAGTASASKAVVLGAGMTVTGIYGTVSSQANSFAPAVTDSGTTYIVTGADKVVTLPATAAGVRFKFIIAAAGLSAASTGLSISPNAADKIMGSILAVVITSADDKDIVNTGATDAEGDFIEVIGDGDLGWYIVDGVGIWARQG